jgi:hypothetical protein
MMAWWRRKARAMPGQCPSNGTGIRDEGLPRYGIDLTDSRFLAALRDAARKAVNTFSLADTLAHRGAWPHDSPRVHAAGDLAHVAEVLRLANEEAHRRHAATIVPLPFDQAQAQRDLQRELERHQARQGTGA